MGGARLAAVPLTISPQQQAARPGLCAPGACRAERRPADRDRAARVPPCQPGSQQPQQSGTAGPAAAERWGRQPGQNRRGQAGQQQPRTKPARPAATTRHAATTGKASRATGEARSARYSAATGYSGAAGPGTPPGNSDQPGTRRDRVKPRSLQDRTTRHRAAAAEWPAMLRQSGPQFAPGAQRPGSRTGPAWRGRGYPRRQRTKRSDESSPLLPLWEKVARKVRVG